MAGLNTYRQRRVAVWIGAMTTAAVLSGCGTRVSDDRLAAGAGGAAQRASAGAPAAEGVEVGALPGTEAGASAAADGPAGAAATTGDGGTTGAADPGAPATGGGGSGSGGGAPAGEAQAPAGASGGGGAGGGPAAAPASSACTKSLSPIRLGQVGTFSGLVGQSTGGMKPGLAVWAQAVNAKGGLECHPVQLTQVDDQNNPQRTESAVSDLVQNKGAQAIVGANVPLTINGLRSGVKKFGIPAVGGDGIDVAWADDPLLFPQGGTPLSAFGGALAAVKKDKGFTKVALLYCAEAAICTLTNSSSKAKGGIVELAGVELVNSEQVTLVQSDYTSACQNAKNAGAQFLFVLVDAAAMRRVASSCAQVNFAVPIAGTAIDFTAESPNDKNLSKVGVYASAPVQPFPAKDTPELKAFHAAYERYLPGVSPDESAIEGWSAGVLLEEALAKVRAKARGGDITTDLIFEGLYALKNETARGLGPGVSFTKGKLPTMNPCYYILTIKDGEYRAPSGSKKFCFPRDPARK